MDKYIARYPAVADGLLNVCHSLGAAYQDDMGLLVDYDESYFNKCLGYEDKEIAVKINQGRRALVDKYVGDLYVLDVGIGSGEFIKKRPRTFGYDVNPTAVAWLNDRGLYRDNFGAFDAFTFWDVLEHVPDPGRDYFRHMRQGAYLFTCLPIFRELSDIKSSKHYRPGEHLYYWTEPGFVYWMNLHGFFLLCRDDYECAAGRDSILSFAFKKT